MKKIVSILAVIALMVASCTKDKLTKPQPEQTARTFTLTASAPAGGDNGNVQTRTAIAFGVETRNIIVKWKQGDKINLYFQQGTLIKEQRDVVLYDFTDGYKKAKFNVTVPEGIDIGQPYTLYGVHGIEEVVISDGKILASLSPKAGIFGNFDIPLKFKTDIVPGTNISVALEHLGTLVVTHLKNTSEQEFRMNYVPLPWKGDETTEEIWYHSVINSYPSGGAHLNLIDNTVTGRGPAPSRIMFETVIPAQQTVTFALWAAPKNEDIPAIKLCVMRSEPDKPFTKHITPVARLRRAALKIGNAYHIEAEWDGTELRFANTYKVGDAYPRGERIMGVVFSVSNGGKNGKIVSLTEGNGLSFESAQTWAKGYNIGNAKWYCPSKNELSLLYSQKAAVNTKLAKITGAVSLSDTWYWTSTEQIRHKPYCINFSNGTEDMFNNSARIRVRAIAAF